MPFQHFDVGGYPLGLLLRRILGRLFGRSGSLRSQEYRQQDISARGALRQITLLFSL
jgi:hypothetical protein